MTTPRPGGDKMRSVEAARAIAALVVVLMHAANLMRVEQFSGHIGLAGVFDFGYVGVDFFFVLSGFIITYVHYHEIGHLDRLPTYLWRRFSRIYPIYWCILSLSIAIGAAGRFALGKGFAIDLGLADIPGTLLLLAGHGEPRYVGVAWSLQFEVLFYGAFCALLASARWGGLLFGAWFALLIGRATGVVDADLPLNLGNAHCIEFLLGVAVGAAARRHRLRANGQLLVAALALLAGAVAFEIGGPFERHSAAGRIALGMASALLLATLVALENGRRLWTPAWLARLGSVSYSIYLGHILFINLTYMVLLKAGAYHALPEAAVFACGVGVAVCATALIGRHVELPLVTLMRKTGPAARQFRPAPFNGK